MRLRVLSTCAILCWTPAAQAQSCADIYGAIRQEAMYCGFFCDQRKIQPLQEVYERQCIPRLVSPSQFDVDHMPYESARPVSHKDATAQASN